MQGQLFDGLGILLFGDLFTILFAPEDNRSFMGRSDVVYWVWVLLTGKTVAAFWACGSLVGIGLLTLYLFCTILWTIGAPSILVL